jgi:hypothetical protein
MLKYSIVKFRQYVQHVTSVTKGCYVHMETNSSLKESTSFVERGEGGSSMNNDIKHHQPHDGLHHFE